MAKSHDPRVRQKTEASVRQRRVSAELRALRKERGYTCADVAKAIDCSVTKISRMETGERGLYVDDVSAILGYLQAPAKLRQDLLGLVREIEKRNWIEIGASIPVAWKQLMDFESHAVALYNFEPLLVPGLLQTEAYAREVIRAGDRALSESEVDHRVRTRLGRQAILRRANGPTLSVIVDEAVLRRPVGEPGVMSGQLHHLLNIVKRPRITILVVPFKVGAYGGLEGPTFILEFADQPTLVHIEIRGATGLLEEPPVIRRVTLAWRDLHRKALSPEESVRFIANLAGEPIRTEEDRNEHVAQEQP